MSDVINTEDRLPTSIRIFLADGRADGFRVVEKLNWTGLGLVCAQSDYTRVRTREEWGRTGVYLLTGPAEGDGLRERLYIGEGDDVRYRVDSHLRTKDFWTNVVAFTSRDDNLNKAHVRYLEARLLQLAAKADRVVLMNGTAPAVPRLSEADCADMEGYLDEMLVILPMLGIVAFKPVADPSTSTERLLLVGKGAEAKGADDSEGFVVFSGSVARLSEVPSIHAYLATLRARLVEDGVLVADGPGLRFTKSYVFNSPSTAAGVVLGRSANGRIEWKDQTGATLKQRQESALVASSPPF